LAAVDATYYAYYDPSSRPSYIRAVEQMNDYVSIEGPFDGVMAFSQGAGLAAMYLVHKLLQEPKQDSHFKVAIFISSIATIYDPVTWFKDSQVRRLDPAVDGQPISIPTAHIWGMQDRLQSECRAVSELSDKASRSVFIHDGGHSLPSSSSPGAIAGAVQAIRRAVTTAMLGKDVEN
jgi:pimeloyl-ACP methyl ester carboxylesterase